VCVPMCEVVGAEESLAGNASVLLTLIQMGVCVCMEEDWCRREKRLM
jgi:hypothetical protein